MWVKPNLDKFGESSDINVTGESQLLWSLGTLITSHYTAMSVDELIHFPHNKLSLCTSQMNTDLH